MIFTPIYSLNHRFEIYINNGWYLIRILVLIKLQYLSVFGRHYKPKNLYFCIPLYEIQVCFCSKRMKSIETIKILLIMLIVFFTIRNAGRIYIHFFNIYTTLRAIVGYCFSQTFPVIFPWWDSHSIPVMFTYKKLNFWFSLWIVSYFFMI